jgi:hypothetical protein
MAELFAAPVRVIGRPGAGLKARHRKADSGRPLRAIRNALDRTGSGRLVQHEIS